jgi:hypothetical protein
VDVVQGPPTLPTPSTSYTLDYKRVGPDIHGNILVEVNTANIGVAGAIMTDTLSTGRTSATKTHAVPAGNDRLLVVSVMTDGNTDVSTVTYAGLQLTQAIEQDSGAATGSAVEIWYLVNPPVGSANVVVNFGGSVDPSAITATNFTGVNQANPIGVSTGATAATGTAIAATLTTTGPNSVLFGAVSAQGGTSAPFTPGPGVTERWDLATGADANDDIGAWGGTLAVPAIGSATFSTTSSTSDDWALAVIEIRKLALIGNSINGLFVRTRTPAGDVLEDMTVAGRFDDTDIVHILQENLSVRGTPGGPMLELVPPPIDLVVSTFIAGGGDFDAPGPATTTVEYKLVYVDLLGNEGLASDTIAVPIPNGVLNAAIRLDNFTIPTGDFVGRRLYRRIVVDGQPEPEFTLVDLVPAQVTTYIDRNLPRSGELHRLRVLDSPGPYMLGSTADGQLIQIDLETGAATLLGPLPNAGAVDEIETDPITGQAFVQYPDVDGVPQFIQQFDPVDASAWDLQPRVVDNIFNPITGLEWVGDVLYGTEFDGVTANLVIINPFINLATTFVGSTFVDGPITGLAFHEPSLTMYGIGDPFGLPDVSNLYTIDLNSGLATLVGPTGIEAGSLEFGRDGVLYAGGIGADSGNLYRIDLDTGAATLIGATGFQLLTGLTLDINSVQRGRFDGSLVVDPAIIVKSDGARIDLGMGATMLAEGRDGLEAIFTSLYDDRYGAGATFDTPQDNADDLPKSPAPGDWGGIFAAADSKLSIDEALIAYAGGLNRIEGSFASFNPIEIHEADARVANTEFEFNDIGFGGQAPAERFGRGANAPGNIFVRGAQPVIIDNIVHDNETAFINVNANAMNSDRVVDLGRQIGNHFNDLNLLVGRKIGHLDNNGLLVRDNRLVDNAVNGMIVRGGTLTTEVVMDDTDIVHVVFDAINVPDFHTFGGLRLESSPTESLVVKFSGPTAGITATGRPIEIDDRIGGMLHVLGQPGFPVVLTAFSDDSAGAGFTPDGFPQVDTNGDGTSGGPGGSGGNLPPPPPATGELQVTLNTNATQLVNAMTLVPVPNGVTITNATYVGANTAAGTYINGDEVPLEIYPRGIILTTGNAVVPVSNTSPSFDATNGLPGDADLDVLAGVPTEDATILTITIDVAAGSGIRSGSFDFHFGSEEYPEFVGTTFNDVFGAFINGGAPTNVIRDSQGNLVTINSGFFDIDNTGNTIDIEYDGMTSGLTARFPLQIGTNVLKIAIGDAGDDAYDSGALMTNLRFSSTDVGTGGVGAVPVAGEWQGLTIDQFAHDRNVESILELESPTSDGTVNAIPEKAQVLGTLAPHEKAGDETLRLGFTVHGVLGQRTDVDVYSFTAKAGTEIWVDVDRTRHALDPVVELIDNLGNVLARSQNSPLENLGDGAPGNIGRRMQKTPPYEGIDNYSTNPRDPGMRLVLPGPTNSTNTYHVRVRSNAGSFVSNVVEGGATTVTELITGATNSAIEAMRGGGPAVATLMQGGSGVVAEIVKGGNSTAVELTAGGGGANEVQRITNPNAGGSFTLSFDGQITAVIAATATAADVQAALEALSNISPGDVIVTAAAAGGPWTVEFTGVYADQNVVEILINVREIQRVSLQGVPTGGSFTLSGDFGLGLDTTNPIPFNAPATLVQAELEALAGLGAGQVTVTGEEGGPWTVTFLGTQSQLDVDDLDIRVNELQTVTLPAGTSGGAFALTFGADTTLPIPFNAPANGGAGSVEFALNALASITAVGGVTVSSSAPGVYEVTFVGGTNVAPLVGSADETQRIINPVPGSRMTLSFRGQTTSLLPVNATALDVQNALNALSTIAPSSVTVTGGAGGPYEVTFSGATFDNQNVEEIGILDVQIMQANAAVVTTTVQGNSSTNEQQVVTLQGNPVGGAFRLTFNGQQTALIPHNALASDVRSALAALSTIGGLANVNVTGAAGGPWTVTFQGARGNVNQPQMTAQTNEFQRVVASPSGAAQSLSFQGQVTLPIPATATAADVQAALVALSNIGANDVVVTGAAGGPWDIEFTGLFAGQNVEAMAIGGDEVQQVAIAGNPSGGFFTLEFNGEATAALSVAASAAEVQVALEGLSTIGAGNVVVTGADGGPWEVRFTNNLGLRDVPLLVASTNEIQTVRLRGIPAGGFFTLTFDNQTTLPIAFNASALEVQEALEALSNIGDDEVSVSGPASGPYQVEFLGTLGNRDVPTLIVNTDSLVAGLTEGGYQLQVRLREIDEFGGSTVRFANIKFAENGIRVLGQPTHSPLASEHTEGNNAANNTPAGAQVLGNLLNADRGVLGLAGDLSGAGDVDWFQMQVCYDSTEGFEGDPNARPPCATSSPEDWWSTIFDIDYADGMGRPNAVIHVFDAATGNLVLSSRDSNITDDRAHPINQNDVSDLNRGSAGALDAYIGPVELDEGNYLVAVSGDTFMPRELQQFFNRNAPNRLLRLEPANSVLRIVDDRIEFDGGSTGTDPVVTDFIRNDPGDTSLVPWHLGDVSLYIAQDRDDIAAKFTTMYMVDPFTGQQEITLGQFGLDIGDIVFNPANNNLHAYTLDLEPANGGDPIDDAQSGNFLQINTGTGGATTIGDDGIVTYEQDPTNPTTPVIAHLFNNNRIGYGIQFNAMAYGDASGRGTLARGNNLIAVGNRGEADLTNPFGGLPINNFLGRRRNIVYQMNTTTGASLVNGNAHLNEAATSAREVGEIFTAPVIRFDPTLVPSGATSSTGQVTNFDIKDGLQFDVDDGSGFTTFEFDSGPEVRQLLPLTGPNTGVGEPRIVDGDFFLLDRDDDWTNGNESMYQFDTGIALEVFDGTAINDGDTILITDTNSPTGFRVFEFERGTPSGVGPNNIAVTIGTNTNPVTIAANLVTAIRGQTGANFLVTADPIGGRIILRNEAGLAISGGGISQVTGLGAAPVLQAQPGNQLVDGLGFGDATQFRIQIAGTSQIFEFNDTAFDPLNLNTRPNTDVVININPTMTSRQVAVAMNLAIDAAFSAVNSAPSRLGVDPAVDRLIINGEGVVYQDIDSSIVNLQAFYNSTGQFFSISDFANPGTPPPVRLALEETANARDVGLAVAEAVNRPNSQFAASADEGRINFTPLVTGIKVPTVQMDVTGVIDLTGNFAWAAQTSAFGVAPTSVSIPFLAADTGPQLAQRMAAAITNALAPTLTATANGATVRLSNGAVIAGSPLVAVGEGPGGNITGIAIIDDFEDVNNDGVDDETTVDDMYAVSDQGGLYKVTLNLVTNSSAPDFGNIGVGNNALVTTTYIRNSAADLLGIDFQGLTRAPTSVEGARYNNTFFAIDNAGRLYNFDETGTLRPVFADGATSAPTGVTEARGLAFGQLERNLWNITGSRGGANPPNPGHGINPVFDRSRGTSLGSQSLHFGNGEGGTVNVNGGAYGTVVSEEFSLEGYSPSDQPVLYFTYHADTQNRDVLLSNPLPMLDSFRVFIAGDDGEWQMLATNNSARGADDEYNIHGGPNRIEELFEKTTPTERDWRQVRVDLAPFAGQDKLRLRFDYSAAGDMNVGSLNFDGTINQSRMRTTGDEARAIEAEQIVDGDTFTIDNDLTDADPGITFEFELGHSLHMASGNAFADGWQFSINDGAGPVIYEFNRLDRDTVNNGGVQIGISGQMTAQQVAHLVIDAINANSPFANPVFIDDNGDFLIDDTEINLPGTETMFGGVGNGSALNPGGVLLLNQATADGKLIADAVTPGGITGLDFTTTDRLFATTRAGGPDSNLVEIDPDTGLPLGPAVPILLAGQPLIIRDIAVQPFSNTIFGIGSHPTLGGFGFLYTISTTGVATLVGNTLTGDDGGLAFAPDGTLYMAGVNADQLHTLSPANGSVLTTVPLTSVFLPGFFDIDGLEVRPSDGVLFGTLGGSDLIFTINPATGASTFVGSSGAGNVSDLAFRFVQTPVVVQNINVAIGGAVQFVTGSVNDAPNTTNIEVFIQRDWDRFQVADAINRTMELGVYDQKIVAVTPFTTGGVSRIDDGDTFTIDNPIDGLPAITFEFESGYVVSMPTLGGDPAAPFNDNVEDNTTAPGVGSADGFQITVGAVTTRFEFDLDNPFPPGELVDPSHVPIRYTTGSNQLAIAKAAAQAINNAAIGITAKVLSGARLQIDTTGNPNVVFAGGQWTSANGGNTLIPATGGKYAGANVVGLPGVASPLGIQNQVVTFEPSTGFLASDVADRMEAAIDASPLTPGTNTFPNIQVSTGAPGGPDQRRVVIEGPDVTLTSTVPGLILELASSTAIVNNNVLKQHEDLLRVISWAVVDNFDQAIGLETPEPDGDQGALEGDIFGNFNSPERAQANNFEGVYFDDIIIGFAERGEMSTGAAGDTAFANNPLSAGGVVSGGYQLEVRRGREVGVPAGGLDLLPSMHTNDRLMPGRTLEAPAGTEISDGRNFSISDGINTLTFEFNDTTILGGSGVTPGRVQINYRPDDTASTIAQRIVRAVNSGPVQAVLKLAAQLNDGAQVPLAGPLPIAGTTTNLVSFVGDVNIPNTGSGVAAVGALPTIGEVPAGTLIDNDTTTDTVGHLEVQPEDGGSILTLGATIDGAVSGQLDNQDIIAAFLNYIDLGSDGGAIDLSTTQIFMPATLIAPDHVQSTGRFRGANDWINWTVDVFINDAQEIVRSSITFDSAQPLGNLRYINYLDQDIGADGDDLLYVAGTFGQPDFRLYTLDSAERVGFSQGGVYQAGAGLVNATYDGWAADRWSDLQNAIVGSGASYSILGEIDAGDLPQFVDPRLGTVRGLADVTTAMAWSVNPSATTATISTLLELVPVGTTGDFNFRTYGLHDARRSDYGDRNHFRDQGQILLIGNEISNSNQWGILVDNGVRNAVDGNTPHTGPVRLTREANTTRLLPGVVVTNNVVHRNTVGGIRFSGDGGLDAAVPFGRIVNNTLYGNGGSLTGGTQADVGIQVDNGASPTLMNNIVANFNLGVNVSANSLTSVLGGMLFQGNDTNANVALGGPGDFPIILANNEPLFVNADVGNFYLKAQSRAIDSSVDSLLDRPALVTVKNPMGISPSPILSPDRDGVGQLRVDDPSVSTPNGFGLNPFKDRGAIDRVDFNGPNSILVNPQDNDSLGVDLDPSPTVVVLKSQILGDFTIRLIDRFDPNGPAEGSDIDDTTVDTSKVRVEVLTPSGPVLQVEGIHYTFSYDTTNNLIRLTPLGGLWPLIRTYRITLDNTAATGIADRAGNILAPNQPDGTHIYTIFLGSAVDFGDLPDTFGTLLASNGPTHQIVGGIHLGVSNGAEPDGQPSPGADLDTSDDGVTFGNLQPGGAPDSSNITVLSAAVGKLDGWFDLDQSGTFEANEYILQGVDLAVGSSLINFTLPTGLRGSTYARFRMTTAGISTPTGPAPDGEVEDYVVTMVGPEFQNGTLNVDVDNDGFVSPIDALLVINYLFSWLPIVEGNGFSNIPLPPREPEFDQPVPVLDPTGGGIAGDGRFIDVNGDGILSPVDALIVINYLNNPPAPAPLPEGEGEGEAPDALVAADGSVAGGASYHGSSKFAAAALLVSPDIVIEERSADSTTVSKTLLDAVQLAGDESLDLAALAASATLGGGKVGQALRLADRLDQELPFGPLDDLAWEGLLDDLAADSGRNQQGPKQSR